MEKSEDKETVKRAIQFGAHRAQLSLGREPYNLDAKEVDRMAEQVMDPEGYDVTWYRERWTEVLKSMSEVVDSIVVNAKVATLIQDLGGFEYRAMSNRLEEDLPVVYTIGSFMGIEVQVDRTMSWEDTNIQVNGAKVPKVL